MIIGIDGHMIGDRSGGNESYYSNILKAMTIPQNSIIYLLLRNGIDASEYQNKFQIVRFKSKNAFIRNFFELPYLCRKLRLELLHTQYFIPFHLPCPVVCTIHDICFEHYKDIFTKKEYIRQKMLIPYSAKKSTAIFTVSEDAKRDISRCYNISEKKIIVTYNAVNNNFKHIDDKNLKEEELREKFHLGDDRYILTVGNLQPRKNLSRLIQAFVQWKKKTNDKAKLVIVGKKAWMYTEILQTVTEYKSEIVLTDYISEYDLIRLYNCATCFIYPSFFEGFGIPPLEAMACGVPVAVANTTSLPEVVGNAGIYFNPFDIDDISNAILQLMSSEEKRKLYRTKGYQQCMKFDWSKSANKIIETYEKILSH